MKNKNTREKGITLIALVVTIVVLLILAGITITFVLGENGIINMAQRSGEQTKISALREKIEMMSVAWWQDKNTMSNISLDDFWDRLVSTGIIENKEAIDKENDTYILDTTEGYVVEVIVNSDENITIGDIVEGKNLPPKIIKIETTATKTSFTAKAIVSRLNDGIIKYYYKLSTQADTEYIKIENASIENGVTVSEGLTEGKIYTIKVVIENEGKITEETTNIVTEDFVPISAINIEKEIVHTEIGGNIQVIATIEPENATNKELTWISSNKSVATVDNEGKITGMELGETTITIKTNDGSNLEINFKVRVKERLYILLNGSEENQEITGGFFTWSYGDSGSYISSLSRGEDCIILNTPMSTMRSYMMKNPLSKELLEEYSYANFEYEIKAGYNEPTRSDI